MASNPPSQEAEASSRDAQQELATATGPFVLRTLLHDVPLSEDGDNDDVRINCVDYLGNRHPWLGQLLMLTAGSQTETSTSAPLPRNCSISSRSPPTLPTSPASQSSYSLRGCARHTTRAPLQGIRNRESSRSSCCLGSRRHACYATTPSPSTPYRSSALYLEPCE